tara:strand:- start:41 stop:331 length:291 start_codon:yes stop_codon:yes gene_type:complete
MDTLIIRELNIESGSDDNQIFSSGEGKEEGSSNSEKFNSEQDSNLRIITNNLHRLNDSIVHAVRNGLTVEIKRASRFHSGSGKWGDQIYLAITKDV